MKTIFVLLAIHILCAGSSKKIMQHPLAFAGEQTHAVSSRPNPADSTTLNGQWYLQPVLPGDTAAGKIPTINFRLSDNSFTGNTGCNSMRGTFQRTDSTLVFNERVVTSRMFCNGYDEAAFLRSLLRTNQYKLERNQLILLFNGTPLSTWTRKQEKKLPIKRA
ncbi:MAG TPA: META domain-containing protein [Chitinophagaceae bacterium]|nr:META domain-containing protein [Chitinophagaceae bacterium]